MNVTDSFCGRLGTANDRDAEQCNNGKSAPTAPRPYDNNPARSMERRRERAKAVPSE